MEIKTEGLKGCKDVMIFKFRFLVNREKKKEKRFRKFNKEVKYQIDEI